MLVAQWIATVVAGLSFWLAVGYTSWRGFCDERRPAAPLSGRRRKALPMTAEPSSIKS
ncbi:hypothetical protein CHELA17_64655 [Chelatococcus asaccharovorans]|nr:hypothetical protein CHELA17_64655 [Chelatococcus asaccharovorans]